MKCPTCGIANPGDARWCAGCGERIAHCRACRGALRADERFCRSCGAAQGTGEIDRPATTSAEVGQAAAWAPPPFAQVPRQIDSQATTRPVQPPSISGPDKAPPDAHPGSAAPPPLVHGATSNTVGALAYSGPNGMRGEIPLAGVESLTIGRESPSVVRLNDPGVSREHARLTRKSHTFEIRDLGSRNGTFVNGLPLRGAHLLQPGDEIEIGPFVLRARPRDSSDTAIIVGRSRRKRQVHPAMFAGAGAGLAAVAILSGVAFGLSRRGGSSPTPTPPAAAQITVASTQPPPTAPPSSDQLIAEVAQKVRPSVVRIRSRAGGESGVGTGIVVDDGIVVTNEHVVRGDRTPMIGLADGREVRGTVLGTDAAVDLAVIQIDVLGLPTARWGDSDALRPGERLIAIGYALGLTGEPTVTSGIFSARRDLQGQSYVQTDTPINKGNSGGPLLNLKGEVIGVNSLVVGRNSNLQAQGINLAIPSNVAKLRMPELRSGR